MQSTVLKGLSPKQRVLVIQADDSAFVATLSPDRAAWEIEIPGPLITDDYYCLQGLGDNPKVSADDLIYLLPSRTTPRKLAAKDPQAAYARIHGDAAGASRTYELHHKTPINQGGGVYDLDNIQVVTPRLHREILEKGYHYVNNRQRAIQIMESLRNGGFETAEKDEEMLNELHRILPDPEFERFLFWGPEGPDEPRYKTMTTEEIVDEVFAYRPIEL